MNVLVTHPHRLPTSCGRSAPQGAMPAARQSRFRGILGLGLWCACVWASMPEPALAATKVTIAVVSLDGDPRHAPRRMEKAYPGHPTGRAVDGVKLAAEDSAFELDAAGLELVVKDVVLPNAAALPKALAELKAAKVQHVVADLPAAELRALVQAAPAALGGAIVFNAAADDDALRGAQCAAHLLHTVPSRAMLSDALAQYLAARNWRKALVLQGPLPGDAPMVEAFNRSAKRYGIKTAGMRAFKLSGDPRERDLGNVRLLTGSIADFVDDYLESDIIKATICSAACVGIKLGLGDPDSPAVGGRRGLVDLANEAIHFGRHVVPLGRRPVEAVDEIDGAALESRKLTGGPVQIEQGQPVGLLVHPRPVVGQCIQQALFGTRVIAA